MRYFEILSEDREQVVVDRLKNVIGDERFTDAERRNARNILNKIEDNIRVRNLKKDDEEVLGTYKKKKPLGQNIDFKV